MSKRYQKPAPLSCLTDKIDKIKDGLKLNDKTLLERLKIFQIVHAPSAEYIKLDIVFYMTYVSLRWGKNLDNIVIIGSLFVLVTTD